MSNANGDMPAIELSCERFSGDTIHASESCQGDGIYINISSEFNDIHQELDVNLSAEKAKKFAEWILDKLEKSK